MAVLLRDATPEDAAVLSNMIEELAHYEGNYSKLGTTTPRLAAQMQEATPSFRAIIADHNGAIAGFAIYFFGYSTWEGTRTLHLEDLYVREEHRRAGIGQMLMTRLAAIARANACTRFEWFVLDNNRSAIRFYDGMGAKPMHGWTRYRLDSEGIAKVLQGEDDARRTGFDTFAGEHATDVERANVRLLFGV